MRYLYYPGCSIKSSGKAYEESLFAVFEALDTELVEIEDWNCCGATSFMAVDDLKALGLAARNFGLAAAQGNGNDDEELHIIAPCSACYLVLQKTLQNFEDHPEIRKKVQNGLKEIGLDINSKFKIRHPLDVLVNDIGYEKIAERVERPLKDVKVVSYYGCQIIRPYEAFDKNHYPTTMDELVAKLGGEAIDWPLKTRCCGGTLMATTPDVGEQLNYVLLKEAQQREADIMITTCPLCQYNLECNQDAISRHNKDDISLPVMYFTQLMGMAFGIPDKTLGLQRLFTPVPDTLQ